MMAESNVRPKKIQIENIKNDRCDIVLYDNIQEITEEKTTRYTFNIYRLNVCYNKNIESEMENNYDNWLKTAKKEEYNQLAAEVRTKRNKLLDETDKEMCLDRLNIQIPRELTTTNMLIGIKQFYEELSSIFSGKIAKYRQELRDITKQEGFPYNVIWPNKEDLK